MKELYESGLSLNEVASKLGTTKYEITKHFRINNFKLRTREEGKRIHDNQHKRVKGISGKRFGRLIVVKFVDTKKKQSRWLCKCDCGNTKTVEKGHLSSGNTKSCGCLMTENQKLGHITHGESHTRLYNIWEGMKRRCSDNKTDYWKNYGGRGISVCESWKNSYAAFSKWAKKNGYNDSLDIDRKDNDGNYEPSNCRFLTHAENSRNSRLAKLNWDTVNQIRELAKTTALTHLEIGKMFGVAGNTIGGIVNNRRWKI
ncbi:hypothetical protein KAR91_38315 [Candidatus Pacearchaeota archaeon]|nr:hypothetical protein [Candidatus Pacearchaeota archaeon]